MLKVIALSLSTKLYSKQRQLNVNIYNTLLGLLIILLLLCLLQHPVFEKNISNCVLYLSWWNNVYTEPDHFLGLVRIPMTSVNLLEGDIFRLYQMTTMGNYNFKQFVQ